MARFDAFLEKLELEGPDETLLRGAADNPDDILNAPIPDLEELLFKDRWSSPDAWSNFLARRKRLQMAA